MKLKKISFSSLNWLFILFLAVYIKTTPSAIDSTVVIITKDSVGQHYLGSGFFVRPNEIITNYHVIKNKKNGYVRFVNKKTKYNIISITGIDTIQDLAIIKISCNSNPCILPIINNDNIKKFDSITTIGNPDGKEGTISQGIIVDISDSIVVSDIRKLPFNKIIKTTALISHGSSGSIVLNQKNEVIGIIFAINGENQGLAISSNCIKKLLSADPLVLKWKDI